MGVVKRPGGHSETAKPHRRAGTLKKTDAARSLFLLKEKEREEQKEKGKEKEKVNEKEKEKEKKKRTRKKKRGEEKRVRRLGGGVGAGGT